MLRIFSKRTRWGAGRLALASTGMLAIFSVIAVFAAGSLAASSHHHTVTSVPKSGLHWLSEKVIACERRGGVVCNPAAHTVKEFPLSRPDRRAASTSNGGLMTEQEALADVNWTGMTVDGSQATVGAAMMTYGQAQAAYPYLAGDSSAAVDPSREVWVLTRYYNPPVTEVRDWGFGPAGDANQSATVQDPYDSVVIDAATGQETDACQHCAAPPPNEQGQRTLLGWMRTSCSSTDSRKLIVAEI